MKQDKSNRNKWRQALEERSACTKAGNEKKGFAGRIANLLVVIFISVMLALAEAACTYEKIPVEPGTGVVRCEVIDAMSGPTILMTTPLVGADVYTYPVSTEGLSDDGGDAFLENVPAGWYNVYAAKKGYYSAYYNVEVMTNEITSIRILLRPLVDGNFPPAKASNPFPNDMKVYSDYINLTWDCTDPNDDIIYYDVYFGKENPPMQQLIFNALDKFFEIDTLDGGSTYYWRINARDNYGAITEGDTWSFRTN